MRLQTHFDPNNLDIHSKDCIDLKASKNSQTVIINEIERKRTKIQLKLQNILFYHRIYIDR